MAAKGLGEGVHSGWEFGEEKIEARADKEEESFLSFYLPCEAIFAKRVIKIA